MTFLVILVLLVVVMWRKANKTGLEFTHATAWALVGIAVGLFAAFDLVRFGITNQGVLGEPRYEYVVGSGVVLAVEMWFALRNLMKPPPPREKEDADVPS